MEVPSVEHSQVFKTQQSIDHFHRFHLTQPELARVAGVKAQSISMQAAKLGLKGFATGNRTGYAPSVVRRILLDRGFSYKKQIIAMQMHKGGSTKTTTGLHLAVRLNMYGAKVLVIDSDGQANMSTSLGYEPTGEEPVIKHILTGEAQVEEAIVNINEYLDLIPSNFENFSIDFDMFNHRLDTKTAVEKMIRPVRDNYDFVIFDCNPSLSAVNISIALASDLVVVPVQPDNYTKRGLQKTLKEFERTQEKYDRPINFKLLYSMHDGKEVLSHKYLLEYITDYENLIFSTYIRKNADVRKAIDEQKTVFDHKSASSRPDFDSFALEVLEFKIDEEGGNA